MILTGLSYNKEYCKDKVFLGEWCLAQSNDVFKDKEKYSICNYHWRNREKFNHDVINLEYFYEKKLKETAAKLNRITNQTKSLDYWRIIVGSSLGVLVTVFWDRWECLNIIEKDSVEYQVLDYNIDHSEIAPKSHYDLVLKAALCDKFNQYLFQKMLINRGFTRFINNDISSKSQYKDKSIRYSKKKYINRLRHKARIMISKLKELIYKIARPSQYISSNYIWFQSDYLPLWLKIKLLISLRKFPFGLSCNLREWKPESIAILNNESKNDAMYSNFSEFFDNCYWDFLPATITKGYQEIRSIINERRAFPKYIFTAGAHLFDDNFKIWAAEATENGSKFYIAPHGGSIPQRFSDFSHQESYPGKLVWNSTGKIESRTRVYPGILLRKIPRYNKRNHNSKLLIVGYEGTTYVFRPESVGAGCLTLDIFEQQKKFIDSLNIKIKKKLWIRPYPTVGWNLEKYYRDELGGEHISKNTNYYSDLRLSKITICTYPETAYLQSMAFGVPTVLLYVSSIWESKLVYKNVLEKLYDAKMIFDDPKLASDHIMNIWEEPEVWWNSKIVAETRELFNLHFIGKKKDLFKRYHDLFTR